MGSAARLTMFRIGAKTLFASFVFSALAAACGERSQTPTPAPSQTPSVYERFVAALTATAVLQSAPTFPPIPSPTSALAPATEPTPAATSTPRSILDNERVGHAVTRLRDGRVLVVGSWNGAEIYDPRSATWTTIAAFSPRPTVAVAVPLADGRAFVGGESGRAWMLLDAARHESMPVYSTTKSWFRPSAVLLDDCRVLVMGTDVVQSRQEAEIYDHFIDTWSTAGAMPNPRFGTRGVRLLDGKVLVLSGANVDLYDPAANEWKTLSPPASAGGFGSAVVLPDGRALVFGAQPWVFTPVTGGWTAARPMSVPRTGVSATLLQDGRVLVLGGSARQLPVANAEIYDPGTGQWEEAAPMQLARTGHEVVLLADGRVLVVGGATVYPTTADPEIYDPRHPRGPVERTSPFVDPAYCQPIGLPEWTGGECPVTLPVPPEMVPDRVVNAILAGSSDPDRVQLSVYGNNLMWVTFPSDGVVRGVPRDGGVFEKFLIFSLTWKGTPSVHAWRLDDSGVRARFEGSAGSTSGGSFWVAGGLFPTPGCWSVAVRHQDQELRFIVNVSGE